MQFEGRIFSILSEKARGIFRSVCYFVVKNRKKGRDFVEDEGNGKFINQGINRWGF